MNQQKPKWTVRLVIVGSFFVIGGLNIIRVGWKSLTSGRTVIPIDPAAKLQQIAFGGHAMLCEGVCVLALGIALAYAGVRPRR